MGFIFALKYFLMQLISIINMKVTLSQTLRTLAVGWLSYMWPISKLMQIFIWRSTDKYRRQIFSVRGVRLIHTAESIQLHTHTHTGWLVSIRSRNLTLKVGLQKGRPILFLLLSPDFLPQGPWPFTEWMFFQLVLHSRGGWSTTTNFSEAATTFLPLTSSYTI